MEDLSLLQHWLHLSQIKYLKNADLKQLLNQYSVAELLTKKADELQQLKFTEKQINHILQPDWHWINRLLQWHQADHQYILHWQDRRYPPQLLELSAPPKLLFCIGDINLLSQPQIALVGSRHASHYGLDNAFRFAADLANQGYVITSGFAVGVDGQAHKGALSVNGKTIAVLGTGPDVVYPKRHQSLAEQIVNQGLLVSEFAPGTQPMAQHFPRRNRLISGLSIGVLVVEAALKSGSLITARYALEQNKEIFAIPSSIHDPRSKGGHSLIQQGAKLIECSADIIEELTNWTNPQGAFNFNNEDSQKLKQKNIAQDFTSEPLLGSLGDETTSVDELVARSQLPTDVVLARLLELELQGLVAAVSGGYVRTRRDEYV